ncbi:MAG: DUF4169 family protein [Yoonia sp.]
MSVVNLNKVRKAKTKAEAKAQADENAVRFGRTKAERLRDVTLADQTKSRLDQLQFEDE